MEWEFEVITEVYTGKDGRILAGTSNTTLVLSCDIIAATQEHTMNAEVEEFCPKRKWPRINDQGLTIKL